MKSTLSILFILLANFVQAQNQVPQISNVETTLDGHEIIIKYDLYDEEGDDVEVTLRVGDSDGIMYDLGGLNLTGDVGAGIGSGNGKTIIWDWTDFMGVHSNFRLMLVANDHQALDIQAIVDQVDSTELYNKLSFIEGIRHRTAGAAHLEAVKADIISTFEASNLEMTIQDVPMGNYVGENIIGRKIGTEAEGEVYILDGHFDSVHESPGADDNGSAVAGFLEALRVLSPYSFKKTIRFIGFDLEEEGLVGSTEYVSTAIDPAETISGVLNFEMIGYYSEVPNSQTVPVGFDLFFPDAVDSLTANEYRGDFITVVADGNSYWLSAAYQSAIDNYVPDLNSVILDIPGPAFLLPDLTRSDHAPFWLTNRPALMLTDGANFRNPYYHTPNDQVGILNFTFMSNVVKAAVGTLAELAEIQHASTYWWNTDFATAVVEPDFCTFQVLPNPANKFFEMHFGSCGNKDLKVQLFDIQGKSIFEATLNPNIEPSYFVASDAWERGIYFLHITNGEKKVVEKIVLN